MDKSVAAKVISNHIHDDVALVILSKLPIKSLFRFSCLRKSWSLLLQNSNFMDMFRSNFISKDHSYYNDTSLILYRYTPHNAPSELHSLFGERFENTVKLDWQNPLEYTDFHPFCAVDGILCMEGIPRDNHIFDADKGRVVLWNPATHEYKVSPRSPFVIEYPCWAPFVEFHGFGYDQISHDYKVIRYIEFVEKQDANRHADRRYESPDVVWEIYCLKSNKWRKLDLDMPPGEWKDQMYKDGVCHWWTYGDWWEWNHSYRESESEIDDKVFLVSFDLSNETFVKTSIPSNTNYIDDATVFVNTRHLNMLNGSIGLISYYEKASNFHISILGEVGIKESWIKLFIVGPLPCVQHPIGIGKKGDIIFRKKDGELVWFNLNTQKIEELGLKSEYPCQIMIYKENFLPFERIND